MKISADFDVDPANEVYKAAENGNPFVEVSINSLKVKEANAQTIAPADVASYSDNLQLNVNEHIQLQGFRIGGLYASYWPTDIYVTANAKLDLANASSNNGTELYAAIKIGHLDTKYEEEYLYGAGIPFELSYTKGTLTLRTDAYAYLLDASGATQLSAYDMLLAGPIGNLVDGLLSDPSLAALKERFDTLYWATRPDEKGEGGKFNFGFQGLVVKNIGITDVLGMLGVTATTAEEPAGTPEEETEEPKANFYNLILYVFDLLSSDPQGKVTLTSKDGLLGTVAKFAEMLNFDKLTTTETIPAEDPKEEPTEKVTTYDWNKKGIIDWAAGFIDPLLRGFTGGLTGADGLLMFGGNGVLIGGQGTDFVETLTTVFEEKPDALQVAFDFTKGFDWDITLALKEDPEVAIKWTSRIGFGEAVAVTDAKARIQAEYDALKDALTDERGALKEDGTYENPNGKVGSIIKAYDDALKVQSDAQKAYDASPLKTDYDTKNSEATAAESSFIADQNSERLNALKQLLKSSTISQYTFNTYLKPTLMNYLSAKYTDTTGHTDETAAALETAKAALRNNFEGRYPNLPLKAEKTSDDAIAVIDELYDDYATNVGDKRVAANAAKAANEASAEYLAKRAADADVPYKQWLVSYAKSRLSAYTRYLANDFDSTKAAMDAAKAVDDAYNTAKEAFDGAFAEVFETLTDYEAAYTQAVNAAKAKCAYEIYGDTGNLYDTIKKSIDQYCLYYAANKINATTITADAVQQKLTAVTTITNPYATYGVTITEADITAIAEAYCNVYSVTIDGSTPQAVKKSDKITTAINDYIQFYAANKKDSETFTTAMVTEKFNALKAVVTENNLGTQLTDATITALAEKYAAAYDVTIGTDDDTDEKIVTGEINNYATATATFNSSSAWFELDFATLG